MNGIRERENMDHMGVREEGEGGGGDISLEDKQAS